MGQMYSQQPTKPSQVLESIMKLSGVIHELLKLDDHSQEGAGATTIRTRRSIIEGIDDLLSRLPPIEHNKLKAFQDDAQLLKHVIKTLTRIYLNQVSNILLVEDLERINPHFIRLLTDSRSVERLTGLAASTLHSIIQISAVTQHPWVASDVLLSQHLKELLFTVLPKDAMEVVENVYDVLEIPTVMAAPPFPQLVGVLNASYNILDKVYSAGDPWAWCEGGCPYTTPLVKQVGVLPRLLAIPYLWGITGVTTNMMALLTNETAWRYYPCSDTTITDLFPPASTVGDLPASWSQLETIKKDVQGLERYFCENFTAITDELTSDTQLTQSVKALIEDLSPGEVDVGSALRLVKSFSRLLTSRDPRDILDVFTTSWETTIIQEFQDSFTEVDVNPQMYMRMMLEMVDQVMVWMGKEVGTQQVASTVQYLMYHTHTVATALTHLLQGEELTLSSLMTVQEDFPPLQLLRQGPVGTADFLLKELTSFATSFVLVEQKETWVEWAAGACNRSVGVSVVVEVVCHYVLHPHTPDVVFSNLTTAVIKALTEYGKPGIQVPQVSSADLYDQLWILVRQLEQFDFNKPNNLSTLEHFWDVTVKEARLLYTGFLDFQKQWPWVVADAAVGQSEELQLLLRKCYTVVSWVNDRLPHTPDHLMDSIPPSIINLHNVLNSSWIDLLDGLHHNIFLNPMLFNQTLQEFCSSASSLVEPVEGSNQFQESVGEVCDVLSHITPGSFNTWLQYEQLMNDLNNNTWQPSTFKLYNTSRTVVAKVVTLLRGVNILEENRVSDATSSPSYVSFSPVLPSYLLQDNWDILMRRIAERGEGSNLTSVMPAVEMVLGWLGANQGSLNTFITSSTLRVYIKSILAHDLQELLQDYPALWQLTETLTQYMPEALKDVINTLSARPVVVSRLLLSLENTENSSSVCGLDLQQVGDDFHSFKTRLCQVTPGELLQELRHIMGPQVSQNPWDLSLEEVINSSVVASSLLMEQVQNGSLLEKFSRPVEYLGLEKWAKLPQEVFNITSEEMLDNSTMIVATVLKPLVELSREPTREGMVVREALKILDIYLRWSKLILSVSRGGDIWRALKEAYDDKPVVIKFFEMVQNLPEFVIEYINFFGNYSVMAHAVLLHRDTPCNLHLFLLDGYYKQQLGDNVSTILTEVLEFVCDPHQIRLLGPQLLPDSSPVIANVTMEVDAAMLALLIDSIGWDVVYFVNGTFYEGDLQAPSWMDSHKWEEVRVKLKNLFAVPIKRMVAGAIGLGLNAFGAYLGDGYMASVIGPVYHLTTRLTESINRSTGILDTNILVAGLGAVKEMHDLAIPRLSRLLGLALWFPESKAYYSLVSGVAQSAVRREMCRDGVDKFLFHPGLDEEDWKALQKMLCSYNYLDVYKGVQPLFNTSDIMSGVTIDWMKVYSNLNRFMDKISLVDPWQLQDFLIKTPHMMGMRNLTTVQKYVRGIFIGMSALQKWMSEDDNPASRHTYALALIKINAALRPITKDGSASLYERLLDPQLFKQLLKDYSYVVQDIQKETTQLNLQNQMGSMLMEEMDPEDTAAALHGAMKNTTYAHLLSQLKTVTLNVLGSIMPAEMTPKTAVTVVDFLLTVASNIVQNMAGVFGVVKTPACYYSLSREEFEGPLQQVASWLSFTEKHLDQWDGYVDLTCGISKLNLTHTLLKLLQDFDWENDIKQMMTDDEVKNQTLSCDIVFDHFANLSQQVKAIVTQYIQDETARQHFLTCLTPAQLHYSCSVPWTFNSSWRLVQFKIKPGDSRGTCSSHGSPSSFFDCSPDPWFQDHSLGATGRHSYERL
ncbi:uncharacterized protein LOC121875159 isoform X2 [Homarus americanus]|uniref:uncharacterized protein LOC121875159 isoform X2 n=1 Tax=Homarus americanus TaxID=6706 RepID=UPI001C474D00|nr:uncharacterized protein LOC121875159 isoform X2 [Homarus americanus]